MAPQKGHLAVMIRIIGSFVSPYVRKVLACMNLKDLAYEVDPISVGRPEPPVHLAR